MNAKEAIRILRSFLFAIYLCSGTILIKPYSTQALLWTGFREYLLLVYLIPYILTYLFAGGFISYFFISSLIRYFKSFKYFNKIDINKLNSREYIYYTFLPLKKLNNNTFLNKFIHLLESNSAKISGNWPDPDFLNVTSNPYITRLAKLEEKWLEAEERMAEAAKQT